MTQLRNQIEIISLLLDNPHIDYRETSFLLHNAWLRVAKRSPDHHPVSAGLGEESQHGMDPFAAPGPITALGGDLAHRNRWLNEAVVAYDNGELGDAPLCDYRSSLADLKTAYATVERARLTRTGSIPGRAAAYVGYSILGAILLCCGFFVIMGTIDRLARPAPTSGLSAVYYTKPNLTGHPVARTAAAVNFDWSDTPPMTFLKRRQFSIHFVGCIAVPAGSPRYLVTETSKLPHSVFVGEEIVIDTKGGTTEKWLRSRRPLPPGVHPISLSFPQVNVPSMIRLEWTDGEGTAEIIPPDRLVPLGGNARFDCPANLESKLLQAKSHAKS